MPDTSASLLQIFETTKQEPLRLETALKGYFLCRDNCAGPGPETDGACAEGAEKYRHYLTRRIRPAVAYLADRCEETHLAALVKDGMVPASLRRQLLLDYADGRHPAQWMMLMHAFAREGRPEMDPAGRANEVPGHFPQEPVEEAAEPLLQGRADGAPGHFPQEPVEEAAEPLLQGRADEAPGHFPQEPVKEAAEPLLQGRADEAPGHLLQKPAKNGQSVWRNAAASRLENIRMAVYRLFPSLDAVLAGLPAVESDRTESMGTDGLFLYYNAAYVTEQFAKSRSGLIRLYLHIVLHCIWRHWNIEGGYIRRGSWLAEETGLNGQSEKTMPESENRQGLWLLDETVPDGPSEKALSEREKRLRWWCFADLQVEQMIEDECHRRRECREILGELQEGISLAAQPETEPAAKGTDMGKRAPAGESETAAFLQDDHRLWPVPDGGDEGAKIKEANRRWELLSLLGGGGLGNSAHRSGRGGIGAEAGVEETALGGVKRSVHSYRSFLRQFAVLREELQIDPDSFDYIYYTLGMERYGSLPLIEPLEYTEGHKLEELVIAIDTSGSCTNVMVRSFLEETYAILGRTENFFRTMSVWVLQCDCTIQEKVHIRSADEWIDYCRDVKVKGRSGTDFRPVFKEVEALRESGGIRDLKCLIYFTDGEGIYPRESPDYETAFVRLHRRSGGEKTPRWALELYVDEIE